MAEEINIINNDIKHEGQRLKEKVKIVVFLRSY